MAAETVHAGPIPAHTGGRTDRITMPVAGGSYVIPADVVSGVPGAEGNTQAGFAILDHMFGSPRPSRAAGASPVMIVTAGGEYVVPPSAVAQEGGGNLKKGHDALDSFVREVRAHLVKTLRKLPGPKVR